MQVYMHMCVELVRRVTMFLARSSVIYFSATISSSLFAVPKAKVTTKEDADSESGAFRVMTQSLVELRSQVAKRKHDAIAKSGKPHIGNAQILAHLETRLAAAEEKQARLDRELQAQLKREALALVPRKRSERIQVLELNKEQDEIDAAQMAAVAKARRAQERAELTLLYLQVYDDFHGEYGTMQWDTAYYAPLPSESAIASASASASASVSRAQSPQSHAVAD
jgi:hypothetical protein